MKKRILLLAAFAAGALGMRAQTVWEDVTSQYVDNPDFEGSYTTPKHPNNDRDITDPEGWDFDLKNDDVYDLSLVNSSQPQYDAISKFYLIPGEGRGEQTYAVRFQANRGDQQITLSQTKMLPKGIYKISADFYTENYDKIEVGFYFGEYSGTTRIKYSDSHKTWTNFSTTFVSDGTNETTFGLFFKHTERNNHVAGVDNVKMEYQPFADDDDYAALEAAINTVKEKTLGFEVGEYAPYMHAEVLKALAEAETIVSNALDVQNAQRNVQNLTDILNDTEWTVNEEELNAFYDGTFATAPKQESSDAPRVLPGWTHNGNFRQILKSTDIYQGLEYAVDKTAIYSWTSGGTYGAETGYEMPLKAYSIYKLGIKTAGWSNNARDNVKVSILTEEGQNVMTYNLGKPTCSINDNLDSQEFVFATQEAGNYVFTITCDNGQNFVFTDLDLRKAESQALEFEGENVVKYAPGTYPAVKINRALTADRWATAVYPFVVESEDLTLATLDELTEDGVLKFASADKSEANVPFLMKAAEGKEYITLTNVAIADASSAKVKDAKINNVTLKGTYDETTVKADATETYVYYVLNNNQLHKIGETDATVPAYRAWLEIAAAALSSEAGLRIAFDDGEATAIEAVVEQSSVNDGKIYDLSGRAVSAPTRGLYIINGKKVMVK